MATLLPLVIKTDGRIGQLPTGSYLGGAGDVYFGSTQYQAGQVRTYASSGVTDSTGKITLYLTTTGIASGAALFTSVKSIQTSGIFAGTTIPPNFNVFSLSADLKTLVIQASVLSVSVLGLLTVASGQSGLTAYVTVIGLP